MTYQSNDVNIGIDRHSYGADAFGRFRVSQPFSVFDSKSVIGSGQYYFDYRVAGGGYATHIGNQALVELGVGSANGDSSVRQSFEYFAYEPGRSQLYIMTAKMDTPKANLFQGVGPYDDDNGIFFENDGTSTNVVLRSSTSGTLTERRIPQSEWNIDKLDGSGISEFSLDVAKANIYVFDYQWLGVGRIRLGLSTSNGTIAYCHEFKNANLFDSVYSANPNLPVRWEIKNDGVTSGASSMKSICASVFSEGGYAPLGNVISADVGISTISVDTNEEVILAVRPRSGYERVTLVPQLMNGLQTTNDYLIFRMYISDVPTAGSWTQVSECCEININPGVVSTVLTGNKIQIATMYGSAQSRNATAIIESAIRAASYIDGTRRCIVMTAQSLSSVASVVGAIAWKEIY